MRKRKISVKLRGEKITARVSGEQAKSALGGLYERLVGGGDAGYAAINMLLLIFGEDSTEKLLKFCEEEPEKAVKKTARVIKTVLFPLAVKQRRFEDRRGVKRYL